MEEGGWMDLLRKEERERKKERKKRKEHKTQ